MKALLRLLAVGAVAAVLLPLLGPLTDHHFTERQPNHLHIYLGQFTPDHVHPYGAPHAHGDAGGNSAGLDVTGSASDIVFLSADEEGAIGSSGLSFAATLLTIFLALLTPPILTLLRSEGQRARRTFTPLLDSPPPRPAL